MAALKVTLPAGAVPVDGLQVSFRAPCSCNTFDQIIIDGEYYWLCDANKRDLAVCNGVWSSGAMLTVTLDVTNKRAYLQNAAMTLQRRNFLHYDLPASLYPHAAGCITVASGTGGDSDRVIRVFDSMFQSGDVLEILNNCDTHMMIQLANSKAYGSVLGEPNDVDGTEQVYIPRKYGVAKLTFLPDRSGWLVSGDVIPNHPSIA